MNPIATTHRPRRAGFTLVEILAALAISGAVLYACSSALIASLRAETASGAARELDFISERLAAQVRIGMKPAVDESGSWKLESKDVRFDSREWIAWTVQAADRPSLRAELDFQQ